MKTATYSTPELIFTLFEILTLFSGVISGASVCPLCSFTSFEKNKNKMTNASCLNDYNIVEQHSKPLCLF